MDGVIQYLQKAATEHKQLKQSAIKANETKKWVMALNTKMKKLKEKILANLLPELPQALPKTDRWTKTEES